MPAQLRGSSAVAKRETVRFLGAINPVIESPVRISNTRPLLKTQTSERRGRASKSPTDTNSYTLLIRTTYMFFSAMVYILLLMNHCCSTQNLNVACIHIFSTFMILKHTCICSSGCVIACMPYQKLLCFQLKKTDPDDLQHPHIQYTNMFR